MQTVHLSIVIPAYNEARRLPRTLESLDAFLGKQPYAAEVLVVDDGSRDDTRATARAFRFSAPVRLRLLTNARNRGKGASVRRGVAAARGEFVLFTDADLSTPIADVQALFAALAKGADVAIGSRAVAGSRVLTPQPWHREFMGKTFNRFVQGIVLPGIHDTQCGFKLFRRSAARRLFRRLTTPRFGFDVEVLYLARRTKLRVAEVPVEWHNSLASTVSPLKDSLTMFADLFRIRWRHRRTQI
ncbi:MAG: glycosyltransferase family 2 protein [Candidatus Firestonebacteria bacterium]|nr:glycosyltransferase family 2 protein [Candidatus Firestonebacteria bacterium]